MRKPGANYRLWTIVALLTFAAWMVWDTLLDDEPEYNVFHCVLKFGADLRQGKSERAFRSALCAGYPLVVYTLSGVGVGWFVQSGVGRFRPKAPPAADPQLVDYDDKPPAD
jgi:hypothetical protein